MSQPNQLTPKSRPHPLPLSKREGCRSFSFGEGLRMRFQDFWLFLKNETISPLGVRGGFFENLNCKTCISLINH
jgi:hypothetical protein